MACGAHAGDVLAFHALQRGLTCLPRPTFWIKWAMPMRDALEGFRAAILATLGHAPEAIEPDRLHRFSTGKRGDASGWCRLFADRRAGVFGCWRLGVSEVWSATAPERMTPAERAALRRQVAQAKADRQREQASAWRRNADRIAFLWRQCRPVTEGDPVHRYLRRRLALADYTAPACIRFHPAMPYVHEGEPAGTWPCMVAPLVGADSRVRALHRTYLSPEGRKAEVPGAVKKLTPAAGLLMGGSIRLHEPRAGVLGTAEGIETALAASCASGVPTVAAYSGAALAAFQWPAGVLRLVVFADHDEAGRKAADGLRSRAEPAGLAVELTTPTTAGADWCDVWAARDAASTEVTA